MGLQITLNVTLACWSLRHIHDELHARVNLGKQLYSLDEGGPYLQTQGVFSRCPPSSLLTLVFCGFMFPFV